MFRYIKHKDIDKAKWDATLERSINPMAYGYSWFLDVVCPGWEALVSGDYEMIFPITKRKKYGIEYLYQPLFIRYLDVFSLNQVPDEKIIEELLSTLKKHFRFIEINIRGEFYNTSFEGFTLRKLMEQHIDLSKGITAPSHSLKQNINKAVKAGLGEIISMPADIFVRNVRNELAEKLDLREDDYAMLEKLIGKSIEKKHGATIGIKNESGGFYCGGFILEGFKQKILIKVFTTTDGKKNGSMSYLRYGYLKSIENEKEYFNFGGSNIPGVAEYNRYFGAEDYYYTGVKHNSLPWPLRLIKK